MPLFKVGDQVERVGPLVPSHMPSYMRVGRVVRVISHPNLPDHLTEYEVAFGSVVATFSQTQLRLADDPMN